MLQGLFILAALLVLWFDLRTAAKGQVSAFTTPWRRPLDCLLLVLIALTNLDLYPLVRATLSLPGYLPGDASSHALVSMHLFDTSFLPQWSDRYVGGFPLGIHYPLLGWVLAALPMKMGANPTLTILCIGYVSALSVPLLFYFLARRNGAYYVSSFASALLLQWLSPLTSFVGNIEAFVTSGLLSQVVCTPILVLWAFELLGKGTTPRAILLGSLCVLTHPQLAASAALILGFSVAVTGNRTTISRYFVSQTAAVLVAGLVYGPGIVSMSVPFGWPDIPQWMHLGFGPDKLGDWLVDGALLDHDRPALLTSMWLACFPLLAARFRKFPAARAALVGSVVGFALCLTGPSLAQSGRIGELIVSVFQPLRTMACLPFIVVATILLTLELYSDAPKQWLLLVLRRWGHRSESRWQTLSSPRKAILVFLCTIPVWLPIVMTLRDSRRWTFALFTAEFAHYPAERPCGPNGPTHHEINRLQQRVSTLRGGRLWIDNGPDSMIGLCTKTTSLERYATVPIASTGAVGAHVGLLHAANLQLDPHAAGLSLRAEAIGVRYLLLNEPLDGECSKGFELKDRFGPVRLYERVTPTDYFGIGCVEAKLSGRAYDLHQRLTSALITPEKRNTYLDPRHFTAIEIVNRPSTTSVVHSSCELDAKTSLHEIPRPLGSYAAVVVTDSPLELVLRATAHPGWRFVANGMPVVPHLVSPGYYAISLAPGRYTVIASYKLPLLLALGYVLALLLPLFATVILRTLNALHSAQRKPTRT